MNRTEDHMNYMNKYLIKEILNNFGDESLENYEIQNSMGIDGFMSAIYKIALYTKTSNGANIKRQFFIKLMKGDSKFRESSKSYIQFANEIFVYREVLALYKELLKQAGISETKVENWVPSCYVAKFGYVEGLSATPTERDSVLVLADLCADGYSLGPRVYLTCDQLLKMAHLLGQFHAMTYAVRFRSESCLDKLKAGIISLPFCNDEDPDDDSNNIYKILYRIAFDRFFDYFDRILENDDIFELSSVEDQRLIANLQRLRSKYFDQPTRLLEYLRTSIELKEEDQRFAAILHGDYNRNNVLFRYKNKVTLQAGDSSNVNIVDVKVEDVKMFDFQEMRFGTPAIDLSFFMYINTDNQSRNALWPEILQSYHLSMFHTLSTVLRAASTGNDDKQKVIKILQLYNYENFYRHFTKFAFYGAMVCMHFLPWLLCSVKECEDLSRFFETDMQGKEFRRLSFMAGGDGANREILEILRHASRMGYMDYI